MDLDVGQVTAVIFLLILANGFFAAGELAIVAARRGHLKQLADRGDWPAKIALKLAGDPGLFLPTIQIGIAIVGTFAAAYGGARLALLITEALKDSQVQFLSRHAAAIGLGIVGLSISFLEVVLGELVPKRLALRNPGVLARYLSPPLYFLALAGRPFVWFMNLTCTGVLRLFGIRSESRPMLHREDIEQLLEEGVLGGLLDPVERQVASEALRLGERTVRDIMQPRIDIDGVNIDTPHDEVLGVVAMAGFSRLPVYEQDLDHIVGFVHVKDVLRQVHLGWPLDLRKLLRPALFVPESLPLDKLMVQFREQRTHIAVVLDEFGGTEGVVTLDSLLEELVGEIRDEHSRDAEQEVVRRDDGSFLASGAVNIDDLFEHLGWRGAPLPTPRPYATLAGLILDQLGRLPEVGEKLHWHGLDLEIVDRDGNRIDRVLISQTAPQKNELENAS
jgi:putative hemolysin